MSAEHIGTLIKGKRSLGDSLSNKTKCIVIDSGTKMVSLLEVEQIALGCSFVLNVFAKHGSVMCEEAFVIRSIKSSKLIDSLLLPNLAPRPSQSYHIEKSSDPASVRTLYSSLETALANDKSLSTSIKRFNAAMSREVMEDKLVDLKICLESIFSAQTEISFRFSLYNAILGEQDVSKRVAVFDLLKKLYGMRSNVVHGNKDIDKEWINDNWSSVIKIAKLALLAKIEFLQSNSASEWQKYLDKRALGA